VGDADATSTQAAPEAPGVAGARRAWLWLAVVIVVTAGVYGPGLGHPFHFDSVVKIEGNARLRDPAAFFRGLGLGYYTERGGRLLTNLSYSLDYHLYGDESFGFHLTDLLLHLGVVVLAFVFGRALARELGRSESVAPLLGAAVFALHPLNTEAVNYLNARSNELVTLFYVASLCLLLASRRAPTRGRRVATWAGFALTVLAALCSKELAASIAVMAPLTWWWTAPAAAPSSGRRWAGRLVLVGVVTAALAIGWGTGVYSELERALVEVGTTVSGHWTRYVALTVLGQSEIFLRYLGLALWPSPASLNVDHRAVLHLHERLARDSSNVIGELAVPLLSFAIVLGAAVWALRNRRRAPLWSFLVLWPIVTHAPTSLVPRGEVMVEYRTYLPMVGICLALAFALERFGSTLRRAFTPAAVRAGGLVLVGVLTAATVVRNHAWRSQESLWRDALAKSPDNYRAHHSLAAVLGAAGKEDEAIAHYRRALELFPPDPEANNNLGNVLFARGELDEAQMLYERAIAKRPNFAEAHANLGRVYAARGEYEQALASYQHALAIAPLMAETHNNLATTLIALGRTDEAKTHFERAIDLAPTLATAQANLAGLRMQQGDVKAAEAGYRKAIALDPQLALAYTGLGGLYASQRRYDDAIPLLRRAVELAADDPVAHNNLGSALAYRGELEEAIALFQRALQIQPGYQDARGNLQRALELQRAGR
jgi:tetratricopeptide (TPR) repeat protein